MIRQFLTRLPVLVVISAAGVGLSTVSTGLTAGLLPTRPGLLFALNPSQAIALLVAHRMPFAVYMVVGVVRLLVTTIAPYLLGRLYGRPGLERVVRSTRGRHLLDRYTRPVRSMALVSLFLSAAAVVAGVAGLARVRPGAFVAFTVVGSAARLAVLWWLAGIFSGQLDQVHAFIVRWQWPLLIAGIAVSGAVIWWRSPRREIADRSHSGCG